MIPVIAIVGRPNVGKSTLFNVLTKTRSALVADMPGVTRDRQYGRGVIGDHPYWLIDTGGIDGQDQCNELAKAMHIQTMQAIEEADFILFMVDSKEGLTVADQLLAKKLRPFQKKLLLVVNKINREAHVANVSEFYQLGLGEPVGIAAKERRGIETLMQGVLEKILPKKEPESGEDLEITDDSNQENQVPQEEKRSAHIALIGRPNVGKSTLINRILGEERVIVQDQPGTTRDSIFIPYEREGRCYTLIDTAGVRRRARIDEVIEKFSVIKTLQAIEVAQVVLLICDAQEGITDQDLHLLGLILEAGRAVIIVMNKWDGLDPYLRERVQEEMHRRLGFVDFARRYFISALHGSGVGHLYRAIDEAYQATTRALSTAELTKALIDAVNTHQPPLSKGRRIRLRYAHLGNQQPFVIVIHGKQTDQLPSSYHRYLANFFREYFKLVAVPILLRFKNDSNPYL